MRLSTFIAAAAFIALGATGARAQVCVDETHCNTTLTATVPIIVEFTGITGTFSFGALTAAQFGAGLATGAGPVTLTHRGNVPYTVTVSTNGATDLTYAGTYTNPNKPVADVTIQATTNATLTPVPLTAGGQTLYTQATAGPALTTSMTADMNLHYASDVPGAYSTTVYFTIATP